MTNDFFVIISAFSLNFVIGLILNASTSFLLYERESAITASILAERGREASIANSSLV